jgi:hypothetical protein
MPFENLPRQPRMGPVAEAYAADILARSRAVAMSSQTVLDVPYGDDYWQRIDLYLPAQSDLKDHFQPSFDSGRRDRAWWAPRATGWRSVSDCSACCSGLMPAYSSAVHHKLRTDLDSRPPPSGSARRQGCTVIARDK